METRHRPIGPEEAIQAHIDWLWSINRILILGLPVDEALVSADAHVRCVFGTWLEDALADPAIGPTPRGKLLELRQAHEQVHRAATKVLSRYQAREPYDEAFETFGRKVVAFNALLSRLRPGPRG